MHELILTIFNYLKISTKVSQFYRSLHGRRVVGVEGDLLIILTILTRVKPAVCARRSHLTMGGADHLM